MKRLSICLLLLALPAPAFATPERALALSNEAAALQAETLALNATGDMPDAFTQAVDRFAITATALGGWNDAHDGPVDLGCIFRGLSEDALRQRALIAAPKSKAARADSVRRLAALFEDAHLIAADAARSWREANLGRAEDEPPLACSADPDAALALLSR